MARRRLQQKVQRTQFEMKNRLHFQIGLTGNSAAKYVICAAFMSLLLLLQDHSLVLVLFISCN